MVRGHYESIFASSKSKATELRALPSARGGRRKGQSHILRGVDWGKDWTRNTAIGLFEAIDRTWVQ